MRHLILLCRRHHRAVHEGGYRVDREGRFFYPWGGEIVPAPVLPRRDPAAVEAANRRLAIDADTCAPGLGGPLDLALAVDDLLALALAVDDLLAIERRGERRRRELAGV